MFLSISSFCFFNAACLILLGVEYLTCNSQKCVYIVEWMEAYTGKEMKQLSDSSRCGKRWSHQSPAVCSNQRWMSPFEQIVMLTWWGRWQNANPASGIWQPLSKDESRCIISQSHTSDFRDPSLQHFQICNTTLLCSSSRKHLCFRCQWTSSYNQFRDTELLVCVTLIPVDRALPGFGPSI